MVDECEVLLVVEKEVIESYAVAVDVEYLQVADSSVVRERVVEVVPTESSLLGDPAERTGTVLSTVKITTDEVVVLPAASRATAVIV